MQTIKVNNKTRKQLVKHNITSTWNDDRKPCPLCGILIINSNESMCYLCRERKLTSEVN